MSYLHQEILIETKENYGNRPPMDLCGVVFRGFSPILGHSVRMAVEGASSSAGAPPAWLRRAADVRVTGFSERSGATVLNLEAPSLGEAAPEFYAQDTFWETKPAPTDTALNVLAHVLDDVRNGNAESSFFDRALLGRVTRLRRIVGDGVRAIRLPTAASEVGAAAIVDEDVVKSAARLWDRTPPPSPVRLVGKLDMIRHSTRSFGVLLEDGTEVRGVLDTQEQMEDLKRLLGSELLILGKAVYRPSGKLLRIDADGFETGKEQPRLFTKVPPPRQKEPAVLRTRVADQHRRGVPAFFGIWPGEESDGDFERMLQEIRA